MWKAVKFITQYMHQLELKDQSVRLDMFTNG